MPKKPRSILESPAIRVLLLLGLLLPLGAAIGLESPPLPQTEVAVIDAVQGTYSRHKICLGAGTDWSAPSNVTDTND